MTERAFRRRRRLLGFAPAGLVGRVFEVPVMVRIDHTGRRGRCRYRRRGFGSCSLGRDAGRRRRVSVVVIAIVLETDCILDLVRKIARFPHHASPARESVGELLLFGSRDRNPISFFPSPAPT